jgi:hypothetical protein
MTVAGQRSGSRTTAKRTGPTLILTDTHDDAVMLTVDRLAARSDAVIVDIVDLIQCEMEVRVGDNANSWQATLDGSTITGHDFGSILVTCSELPSRAVQDIHKLDRLYAYDEMTATLLALLVAGPAIARNLPTPPNLAGRLLSAGTWCNLARSAGLSVQPCTPKQNEHLERFTVLAGTPFGNVKLPVGTTSALRDLSRQLPDQHVFEVWIDTSTPVPTFGSATCTPNYATLSEAALIALTESLR